MANTKSNAKNRVPSQRNAAKPQTEPIETIESTEPIIPKSIDPDQYVTVRNGFQGRLIYKSSRTGELFIWDGFGTEQEMTLRELHNAKNTSKKFFINNWFMFDEGWIIDYLGVKHFYKNSISIDNFNDIFKKAPTELREVIQKLSDGQKKSVAYRASELIASGEIDSRKIIATLEDALGVDLIEK